MLGSGSLVSSTSASNTRSSSRPDERVGRALADARVGDGGAAAAASRSRAASRGGRTRSRSWPAPPGPPRAPRAPRARSALSAGKVRSGHAELAQHVGRDGARPRVLAVRELARGRQHGLVAAPRQRGHVRRPLGVRAPLADRELDQLLERAPGQPRVEPEVHERRIGAAAQPVLRGHRPPARRPDLEELERAAVAAEQQAVAVGAHAAPRAAASAVDRGRDDAENDAVRERHARADVRAQRAHGALLLLRRPRRVERAVARLDLLRVGDARLVLLGERRPLVERAHEQLAAELAQARRASRSRRRGGSARAPAGRPARRRGRRSGA